MREELAGNPLDVLARWVAEAQAAGLPLPSTMTLATAGDDGVPHARTVLVTSIDATSVRFHSSRPTTKTRDLQRNPAVSAVFHWPALGRQVVLQGTAAELDAAASRAAFPTRPRQLQLIAWVYESLAPALTAPGYEVEHGAVERSFDDAARDPATRAAPPSWTTIRLVPDRADFWQAGTDVTPPDRIRFVLDGHPVPPPDSPAGNWRCFPVLP
ncbi:pyridoxine/pyridoxamine 5'-phosphate oxidase [Pseudonocardia sp. CA-142604]|uniref:pyridoxine/pyridoxamine 5'-phosphate oxidase n=1 Tax=Pseudonocardia sp. CA-142604 TaxID=3240024 RepID=UPI003D8F8D67